MALLELLFNALVVLLFIAAAVLQRRSRRSEPPAAEEPPQAPAPAVRDLMWEPIPMPTRPAPHEDTLPAQGSHPAGRQSSHPTTPGAPQPSSRAGAQPYRRTARPPLFHDRRDLHRAVVTMTLLGPCRAQEPYELPPPRQRH